MSGVVYDAGALIAAERNDRRMWAIHAAFLSAEVVPSVPTVVLAQAWRGGPRQTALARMLRGCDVEALDEVGARSAGALLSWSGRSDVIDAVVAERASHRKHAVVTSDPADIRALGDAANERLRIHVI